MGFIIAKDGRRAGMQGFGYGEDQCSHFWVAAEGRLIDVGPHLLPSGSSYPVAPMPFAAWDLAAPLPAYLRYRPLQRFPAEAVMSLTVSEINARCERFIAACRSRAAGQVAGAKAQSWLLTNDVATQVAAQAEDAWALGAVRFESMSPPLPF